MTDGDPLGLFEGDCDGLCVGFAVGVSVVGVMTGLLEGELVIGALVGACEGDRLGLGVGCELMKEEKESYHVRYKKFISIYYKQMDPFGYPFLQGV